MEPVWVEAAVFPNSRVSAYLFFASLAWKPNKVVVGQPDPLVALDF